MNIEKTCFTTLIVDPAWVELSGVAPIKITFVKGKNYELGCWSARIFSFEFLIS